MKKTICLLLLASSLSGCGAVGRLKEVGKAPRLTAADPVPAEELDFSLGQSGGRQLRSTSVAATAPAPSASLFRTGSGAFLGDPEEIKAAQEKVAAQTKVSPGESESEKNERVLELQRGG